MIVTNKKKGKELAKLLSDAAKKALAMTESEYEEYCKTCKRPDPKTIELISRIVKECLSEPTDGSSGIANVFLNHDSPSC